MDDVTAKLFQDLGISLVLGLLVGLQRQQADSGLAGMRTLALYTVLGTVTSFLAKEFDSGWIIVAGLLGVLGVLVIGNFAPVNRDDEDQGTTTEVAILMMFAVGAYVPFGPRVISIAIGAGTAILLQFKPELHGFSEKLGDKDLRAVMQFVLITCIILPVLPNEEYGPYNAINPFETWLMVVLIVGISLGGYVAYKFFGSDAGVLLGGMLGGSISSTATTVSYSRQTALDVSVVHPAAVAIMIASTVVHVRVLVEMAVVSPQLLSTAALPVLAMMTFTLVPAVVLWLAYRRGAAREMPPQENPTQLRSAIAFGLMYAIVLLTLEAGEQLFDKQGLFVVAAVSGLTDMDAITLSTARMVDNKKLVAAQGWQLIIVGLMSNLVFKSLIVAFLGHRRLLWIVVLLFAIPFLAGVALLMFWPASWEMALL
jgi:uncharacterized membrane protein (DUF4010 family)